MFLFADEINIKLGKLTMHAKEDDDPNIVGKEDESDAEDDKIVATDNLIAVGHVEDDVFSLEIYGKIVNLE